MKYQVGVIAGDGIGPEVVAEAQKVLNCVADKFGHEFEYEDILMGGCSIDATGAGMGMMGTIIWIAVLLVFIFIFMLRPQKKEQARRNEMMAKMAVGDTVLTSSGFYGTLIDITDDTVIVEFGNNKNCRIPMQRAAIAQIEKADDAVEE